MDTPQRRLGALILAMLLLSGCAPATRTTSGPPDALWSGHSYDGVYTLSVDQPRALLDRPLAVRVAGLHPGQPVLLRGRMTSAAATWESWATYTANAQGMVEVSRATPTSGTYIQADGMGLFWSMVPVRTGTAQAGSRPATALVVTLTVEAAGRTLTSQQIERLFYDEATVRRRPVDDAGLVAALYLPNTAGPHPAVICLPGSEGGTPDAFAALLASHGFAALALAYFGAAPLPPELVQVPLEYGKMAIDWLKTQPEVDAQRVGILGGSKGAELALLLASTYPEDLHAVIAYKPSSVVWMGLHRNPADNFRGPKSSWTKDGSPLPFVNGVFTFDLIKVMIGRPAALASSYAGGLRDTQAVAAAAIPVERMRGPVLLISGREDQLSPSTEMADMIMRRLDQHGFPYRHEHLAYEAVGHGLALPNLPTTTINRSPILQGGTPQATAAANADAWPKALAFLKEALR